MNVYQKLQEARCQLQNKQLKKSGKNSFAKYSYYELADFLPTINEISKELGLCNVVSFENEYAKLTIIDTAKPEDKIEFTSPMAEAGLKSCTAVQNLGATETYLRRYLYTNAYEIVEADMLDGVTGKETAKPIKHDCEDCGKEITPFKNKNGKIMTVDEIEVVTINEYGRPLCLDCAKKAGKEAKAE